jgi:hypothetical protein
VKGAVPHRHGAIGGSSVPTAAIVDRGCAAVPERGVVSRWGASKLLCYLAEVLPVLLESPSSDVGGSVRAVWTSTCTKQQPAQPS